MSDHLYGLHDAEYMHDDPCTVYEEWEADLLDDAGAEARRRYATGERLVIEEWSTLPNRSLLPTVDTLTDCILDHWVADEVVEHVMEQWQSAAADPEVVAAFEATLTLLASKVHGLMSDRRVRDLIVTWDAGGNPLLDGEPMYRMGRP